MGAGQHTAIANLDSTRADSRPGSVLSSVSHSWRALRNRNFKLFFAGQGISLIGTWMTRVATAWLVYRLTHSALLLGIVSFAAQIVSFALGPVAGVWVERLNRRKLLLWTQTAAAAQSLRKKVSEGKGVRYFYFEKRARSKKM